MAFDPSSKNIRRRTGSAAGTRTHSMRSDASQWKDLTNRRKPNIKAKAISKSSRKIVKANKVLVTNIHSRS